MLCQPTRILQSPPRSAVVQCRWLSQISGHRTHKSLPWREARCTIIHSTLDIARWKAAFPLASERAAGCEPEVAFISGPRTIAVLEQLREEAFGATLPLTRVPTDVFVWSSGEPAHRAA